jgi:hypothetical protein
MTLHYHRKEWEKVIVGDYRCGVPTGGPRAAGVSVIFRKLDHVMRRCPNGPWRRCHSEFNAPLRLAFLPLQ